MKKCQLIACLLVLALFSCGIGVCAERPAPNVVGANAYKKQPDAQVLQPFTYTEATIYLAKLIRNQTLGSIVDAFGLKSFLWSNETVENTQTLMEMTGDYARVTLVLNGVPFGGNYKGSGVTTDLYPATRDKTIAELRLVEWDEKGLSSAFRDVDVGSTLETLLTEFGITEISPEGLIYDNDILYADEGSEDSDFQYHPEQHAIIYKKDGQIVIEFTAYEADSDSKYVLTYRFEGEKIAGISLKSA